MKWTGMKPTGRDSRGAVLRQIGAIEGLGHLLRNAMIGHSLADPLPWRTWGELIAALSDALGGASESIVGQPLAALLGIRSDGVYENHKTVDND